MEMTLAIIGIVVSAIIGIAGVWIAILQYRNRQAPTPDAAEQSPRKTDDPPQPDIDAAPSDEQGTWRDDPFPASKLPRTGEHLIGRSKELATLTRAWNNDKTRIVQIVAPGGVGKTQLVKKWREGLLDKDDQDRPPVRAYDWSFYSQGTQQQASADDFFDKALRWFGEPDPEKYKDPWAKGERLAQLVKERPTLLILDGLEPCSTRLVR